MNHRPAYAAKAIPAELERAYIARNVLYLLGANDNDEHAEELDIHCMAEAEGKHRLARGHAYFEYMQKRHPDLGHHLQEVPGVAHSARDMFTSRCGVAALFERSGCEPQDLEPNKDTGSSSYCSSASVLTTKVRDAVDP